MSRCEEAEEYKRVLYREFMFGGNKQVTTQKVAVKQLF